MTKFNKIRTGIIATAIVLSCNLMSWAQSGKASATPTVSTSSKAQEQYSPGDEMSSLRASQSKVKADLENGLANKSLSQKEIESLQQKLSLIDGQLKAYDALNAQKMTPEIAYKNCVTTGKISRADFMILEYARQKEIITNSNIYTITDLVNTTGKDLNRSDVFYITVNEFWGSEVAKQIHMLNNPANYMILSEAASVPSVNSSQQATMSRADYNAASPEKKKAIREARIVIVD